MTTASHNRSQITMWKLVMVGICLCVFVFGLQAKLAQYQPPSPSVTAVSSAKLWDGDHRMEAQNLLDTAELLALALLFCQEFLLQTVVLLPPMSKPAPVRLSSLVHLRRFFRPPPIY